MDMFWEWKELDNTLQETTAKFANYIGDKSKRGNLARKKVELAEEKKKWQENYTFQTILKYNMFFDKQNQPVNAVLGKRNRNWIKNKIYQDILDGENWRNVDTSYNRVFIEAYNRNNIY